MISCERQISVIIFIHEVHSSRLLSYIRVCPNDLMQAYHTGVHITLLKRVEASNPLQVLKLTLHYGSHTTLIIIVSNNYAPMMYDDYM